jgi:hypothetical protein
MHRLSPTEPNYARAWSIPAIIHLRHFEDVSAMDDACHILTFTGVLPAIPRLRYERYWLGPRLSASESDYNEFMAFMSPPATMGANFSGITGSQGPTR